MEQTNYEGLIPTEPPEGLIEWMRERGCFNKEYIVYKQAYVYNPLTEKKEKMVECRCSACGEVYYLPRVEFDGCSNVYARAPFGFENIVGDNVENVISGTTTICPHCGAQAEAIHCGQMRYSKTVSEHWPMTVCRVGNTIPQSATLTAPFTQGSLEVGDRLAIVTWYVCRHLNSDGTTRVFCNPWEAYVAEDRKVVKLAGYQRFTSSIAWYRDWHQRERFVDSFGKIGKADIYPFDENVLIGTSAENCKLDKYINDCKDFVYPISYMNLWVKHKNVENLIMQGMARFVNAKLDDLNSPYYSVMQSVRDIKVINWKAKRPNEMLGLTKEEYRLARKFRWKPDDLEFYKDAKAYGIKPEDVDLCKLYDYYNIKFLFAYDGVNIMRTLRYINKQAKKYSQQRNPHVRDITDYWDMMKELKEDLSDERIRYPQNLIQAHDVANERIEYNKSQAMQKQFDERMKALSKYIYEADGFIIRPAGSQIELVAEGKNLNHCVARYASSHAKGETAIFFIRYKDSADTSYFTLELDEKKMRVLQNRGKSNCARTDEVKAFEEKWLAHIKEIKMKEKKKNGKRSSKTAA